MVAEASALPQANLSALGPAQGLRTHSTVVRRAHNTGRTAGPRSPSTSGVRACGFTFKKAEKKSFGEQSGEGPSSMRAVEPPSPHPC